MHEVYHLLLLFCNVTFQNSQFEVDFHPETKPDDTTATIVIYLKQGTNYLDYETIRSYVLVVKAQVRFFGYMVVYRWKINIYFRKRFKVDRFKLALM